MEDLKAENLALKAELADLKANTISAYLHTQEVDRLRAQLKVAIQILREEVVEGIDFDIAKLRAKSALSQLEGK